MSDVPHGPDWWRASNGLYYPPDARPGMRRPTAGADHPTAGADHPDDRVDDLSTMPSPPDDPPIDEPSDDEPFDDEDPEPRPRRGSRAWIVAAILVGAVILAAAAAGVWLLLDDDEPTTTTTTSTPDTSPDTADDEPGSGTTTTTEDTGEVSVFDVGIGDCFDTADVDEGEGLVVSTVFLVECDEEHLAEVYAVADLDAARNEPFPGTEERDLAARALCEPEFEDYVGVSLAESELVVLWLAPTEESWEDGDREVACAVTAPEDERLTGSVEGSAR